LSWYISKTEKLERIRRVFYVNLSTEYVYL
jgi:hypothetical protein